MAHRVDCSRPEYRTPLDCLSNLDFNYLPLILSQIHQQFEILPNFMVTMTCSINIWDNNQIGNMELLNSLHWRKFILILLSKRKHSSSQIKNIISKLSKIGTTLTIIKEGLKKFAYFRLVDQLAFKVDLILRMY